MKNLKSKLLASVAMLLVSTVMLTSASFAWFTISTAPEISNLTTQVVVNDNLEIALASTGDTAESAGPDASGIGDTGNAYTWGNIVDLGATGDAKTAYDALDKTLRPAKLDGTAFKYPTYGADGRISELAAMSESTMANGFGKLTDASNNVYGYYVDFWLRSNVAGKISLTTADEVDRGNGEKGKGSTFTATGTDNAAKALADNIRVAFKVGNTTTEMTTTDTEKTAVISGTVIDNLAANTPTLVRMYVYLDGTNMTNAHASLTSGDITGALNIQFVHEATLDAMDDMRAAS